MTKAESNQSHIAIHRHALLRVDEQWRQQKLNDTTSRFLVNHQGKYPTNTQNQLQLLTQAELDELCPDAAERHFLAEIESSEYQCHVFCCQLSSLQDNAWHWSTLRHTDDSDELTGLALHAQGLLNWHKHCRFCECCGSTLENKVDGHAKICTNSDCQREVFPRINPAVIVLVIHEDKCLLAHAHRFKGDIPMYSCLAGYMETGENFEQTLHREVMEEVGVELGDCQYLGNQPWPFPHSLMIGFHAEAKTTELTYHDGEIRHARWFSVSELVSALKSQEIRLPTPKSIAYHLLDHWLQQTATISLASLLPDD